MASVKLPGKCDICTKKDGFKNHNLQRCKTCHLLVHETCNGMVATTGKNPDWECLACESLHWDPKERGGVRQIERPAECCFCSVSEGIHAMHPLYDTYGEAGKQIILQATTEKSGQSDDTSFVSGGASMSKPRRLAWVHSLCAFYIGSYSRTAGMVYSCDADGKWDGGEGDDDDEEEEFESDEDDNGEKDQKRKGSKDKQGYESDDDDDDGGGGFAELHRFVVNDEEQWANTLKEHRTMKCSICGFLDKKGKSLKITLQCCAGDADELPEYAQRHSAHPSEPCYVAFHVGCARWMGDPPYPRVFFYPGANPIADDAEDDTFPDPVCCAYCDAHARDISTNRKPKAGSSAKQLQTARMKAPPTVKAGTPQRRSITKSVTEAKKGQKDAATSPRLPPQAARAVASSKQSTRAGPDQRHQAVTSGTQSAARRKSDGWETWFPQVKKDVIRIVREEQRKNSNVAEATSQRRVYWKETSALPKSEFKLLWAQVKDAVKAEMLDGPVTKTVQAKAVAKKAVVTKAVVSKVAATKAGATKVAATKGSKAKGVHAKEPQAKAEKRPGFAAELNMPRNQEASPNPWEHLWVPNYDGKMFSFDEWDTIELVKPVDDAK